MNIIAQIVLRLYALISKLPLNWLYVAADVSSWFVSHVRVFPFNELVRKRLSQAFPEESEDWIRNMDTMYYKKIADFGAEFVKYISWNSDDLTNRMHFKNVELLKKLLDEHRYVVCYSGHFVNYELFTGFPIQLSHYGMCSFYDDSIQSDFPFLDCWLKNLRSRFGCKCIPISSPLKPILQLYEEIETGKSDLKGFVLGSLLDTRKIGANKQTAMIMGEEFPLHYGTEKIGKLIGAAFVYAHIECTVRGQYEVTIEQLKPDTDGSYMNAYLNALERNIRKQPFLWLMWGGL